MSSVMNLERIFVGIMIPPAFAKQISQLYGATTSDKRFKNCKWVPEDNLHITLSFIGEISSEKRQDIQQALRKIQFTSFSLKLKSEIETFPTTSKKNLRVLHLPVHSSNPLEDNQWSLELEVLKESIDQILEVEMTKEKEEVAISGTVDHLIRSSSTIPETTPALATPAKRPKKDRFHPHLTIARVRQHSKVTDVIEIINEMNQTMQTKNLIEQSIWNEMSFHVEEFILFRSTFSGSGTMYGVIESYRTV